MKAAALGFYSGVRAVLGGLGFIVTTPSTWGWSLIPMTIATALFGGTSAVGIWGGSELALRIVGDPSSTWGTAGMWALRVLFWAVGLVIAFFVAMSLAQPLSGFALDAIARKQELARGGRVWPDQPLVAGALRSLRVTLTALALGLPVLGLLALVTFLFPPAGVVTIPLKFVVTALMIAWDFLDYPLSVRGVSVPGRLRFLGAHFAAVLGFGLAAGFVLLVPGVGLFLLPIGVAGATRLVLAQERLLGPGRPSS